MLNRKIYLNLITSVLIVEWNVLSFTSLTQYILNKTFRKDIILQNSRKKKRERELHCNINFRQRAPGHQGF